MAASLEMEGTPGARQQLAARHELEEPGVE